MGDFLDDKRNEIAARMKELKPLVAEYERLLGAAAALDGVSAPPPAARRGPARPRGSAAAPAGARRVRPASGGGRGDQALELVKTHPGITIPEIAQQMGIKQNYLYRVLPSLADAGLVYKEGRGWKPSKAA